MLNQKLALRSECEGAGCITIFGQCEVDRLVLWPGPTQRGRHLISGEKHE